MIRDEIDQVLAEAHGWDDVYRPQHEAPDGIFRSDWERDDTELPGAAPAKFDQAGNVLTAEGRNITRTRTRIVSGMPIFDTIEIFRSEILATDAQKEWSQGSRDGKLRAEDVVRTAVREMSVEQAEAMLVVLKVRYNEIARERSNPAALGKCKDAIRQLRNVVRYGKDAIAPVIESDVTNLDDEALLKDATEAARAAWREGYRLGKIS